MTPEQESRLRDLSKSSIVGGDIKAALDEIDKLRKSTKTEKLIGIINELLEAFNADQPCDCGGSFLCAVCRAQEAVNKDFKKFFPDVAGQPYSYLDKIKI